jgi:starch-binding outer membrane protein, SusD/RagB family
MRQHFYAIGLGLGLGLGATGCSDFLTGPKLTDNPNRPTVANNANLLVSAETNLALQSEGHMARTICIWMQQCAGTSKQYLALGQYIVGDDDYIFEWQDAYTRGGLLDLRRIQHNALDAADSAYGGVAKVLEAWLIGQTTDVWGDIPYSTAVDSTVAAPTLDPQEEVYAALQAKLDTAIAFLATTTAPPQGEDLVYEGDVAKWTELAHTLKARLYLHTAERVGLPAYQAAFTEASSGISAADGSGDYLTYHSGSLTESNLWNQFVNVWAQYVSAGKFLVDLLNTPTPDPRLDEYFKENSSGQFVGVNPGQGLASDPSELSDARLAPDFRQPLVTYVENQLILAEAAWQVAGGGGAGNTAAQPYLDAARSAQGLSSTPVTGLETIMTEKYIALFQNPEVWNDYKRTCIPALVPAGGASQIPARLTYPLTERNANPSIPDGGPQRNWNDPNPC